MKVQVTFTGLNLFLVHENGKEAAVLQPDCTCDPTHPDGSQGKTHIGYLRFDLANLCGCLAPANIGDIPRGEGIYRFDHDTLELGIPDGDTLEVPNPPPLPDFGRFAPGLVVPDKFFTATPGEELLMRMILRGGGLAAQGDPNAERQMPQVLNPKPCDPKGVFTSTVVWTRDIEGRSLTLKIRGFDGRLKATFPLSTAEENDFIALKVANICLDDPLEWNVTDEEGRATDDEDFKWLYRLLAPSGRSDYETELKGSPLPIPRVPTDGSAGVENCIGGIKTGQTFSLRDNVEFILYERES